MKTVILKEVLTDEEILRLGECQSIAQAQREVVEPILDRINKATGQNNDPTYLAYWLLGTVCHPISTSVASLERARAVAVTFDGVRVKKIVSASATAPMDAATKDELMAAYLDYWLVPELQRAGAPVLVVDEDLRRQVKQLASLVVMAPLRTARNVEVAWMAGAWLVTALDALGPGVGAWAYDSSLLSGTAQSAFESFAENSDRVQLWILDWLGQGFSRVEVSHKLASALALTEAPGAVPAPWTAFSIVVPDGMFEPYARICCAALDEGVTVVGMLHRDGSVEGMLALAERDPSQAAMLSNFARSVCLAIDEHPQPANRSKLASYSKEPQRRAGVPPGALYRVGRKISVDLREEVSRVWRGERKGGSPTVQFLVRGHWRNQAHGPGRALRRRQWIEPFWKGPEDARVLLRAHGLRSTEEP